jgi:cytochrome c oxidase assembly factor CtaG
MTVSRRWPGLAAAVLVIVSLVPPVGTHARQYVFAETLQFALFAIVTPALLVLAAPWRLFGIPRGNAAPWRLSGSPPRNAAPWRLFGIPRGNAVPSNDAGPTSSNSRVIYSEVKPSGPDGMNLGGGPAGNLASTTRRRSPFVRAAGLLVIFAGVSVVWRLPVTVDALARHPGLAVLELVTLAAAGTAFWLELLESPPFVPRLTYLQRAVLAALAMWITWILAYILGFSHVAWFHAYIHAAGKGLSTAADQQIATGALWAVAAVCFLPVIFVSALAWLADSEDPDAEFRGAVRVARMAGVKGWGRQTR